MTPSLKRNGETVFLTGAAGYVGSVVAEKLHAAGYMVRGLVREESQAAGLRNRSIEPFVGDVRDAARMADGAAGAAAIVHTAGPNDPSAASDMQKMIADAAAAVSIMVDHAKAGNARALITSGTSVYGHTGGRTVDETAPMQAMPGTEKLKDLETDLTETGEAHFIRLSVVYGRGESAPMRKFIQAIHARGRTALVNPENRLSLVNVDDLADLYVAILEHDSPPPIVNAVSEILHWTEVMAAVAKATGVSGGPDVISPDQALALGGPAMFMPIDMAVSANLAREALGWRPSGSAFEDALPHDK